jgi:hypothetical protein
MSVRDEVIDRINHLIDGLDDDGLKSFANRITAITHEPETIHGEASFEEATVDGVVIRETVNISWDEQDLDDLQTIERFLEQLSKKRACDVPTK